jgi:hypothetical protein
MNEAAEAMRKLSDTLQASINGAAHRLAPRDDPEMSIEWLHHDNGDISIVVRLQSGRIIRGRGPGKLEALGDAEQNSPREAS